MEGATSPVEYGVRVYQINCVSCHTVDGSEGIGPSSWQRLAPSASWHSGETVVMDEEYVRQSIINPGSQVVQGFSNVMPPGYGDTLAADEIDALVAYIKSLSR